MPSRLARAAVLAAVFALLLSGCEMTVRIGARVAADGSGTLRLAIALDRELHEGLMQAEGDGLRALEALFERLGAAGWAVSRRAGDDGLSLAASRAFDDEAGFASALGDIASDRSDGAAAPFRLDVDTQGSFFRTSGRFSGEIDTTGFAELPGLRDRKVLETFREEIARVVRFEIEAAMPGSISIVEGDGTIRDGVAVWRPQFGSRVRFSAASSALKLGSLGLVAGPALALLALLIWMVVRRHASLVPAPAAGNGTMVQENGETAPATALVRLGDFPPIAPDGPVVSLEPASIDLTESPAPSDPVP